MTGPEHYTEAERLLLVLQKKDALVDASDIVSATMAAAQVHAMLALAAATALQPASEDFVQDKYWPEFEAWAKVCSVVPPAVSS